MYLDKYICGFGPTNTYVIGDEKEKVAAIIDPAEFREKILEDLKRHGLILKYILITHGHCDHIGAVKEFKELTGAEIVIHQGDVEMLKDSRINMSANYPMEEISFSPDKIVKDGDVIDLGGLEVKVIHTPGHTKGGVCFHVKGKLFSGDTLFAGSIGRTDLYGGSTNTLINSIKSKLMDLDGNTKVFPGHGESTNIKTEKRINPFINR